MMIAEKAADIILGNQPLRIYLKNGFLQKVELTLPHDFSCCDNKQPVNLLQEQ